MKTVIVGLGLIGGSIALELRESGFSTELIGVDTNAAHRKQARELALVDSVASLEQALPEARLVILAIPVTAIASCLPQLLSSVSKETTVTDMGSTKRLICDSVRAHPNRLLYVPSHPMAGTENSGPNAALKGLFAGKTAVICDSQESDPAHLKRVESLYSVLRMRQVHMSSTEHDLHAAYVSHLSHISSFVLANTVLAEEQSVKTIFDLAGGGFESTVRLAKSSPGMWSPIFEQNHQNITHALEAYISHLKRFHESLLSRDWKAVQELMENANQIRRVLQNMGQARSEKG